MPCPPLLALLLSFAPPATDAPARTAVEAPRPAADAAPRTYTLRYRFRTGEVLRMTVANRHDQAFAKGPQRQTVRQRTESEPQLTVVSTTADGDAVLEVFQRRVTMWTRFDDQDPHAFDSDDPAGQIPPQFRPIAATVGVPLAEITMTDRGVPTGLTFLLDAKVRRRIPGLNSDSLASYTALFPTLPAGAKAVGERWVEEVEVPVMRGGVPARWTMRQVTTLESVAGGVATLSVKSDAVPPPKNPEIAGQLAPRQSRETITFDLAAGRVLSREGANEQVVVGMHGPGSMMRLDTRKSQVLSEVVPAPARVAER